MSFGDWFGNAGNWAGGIVGSIGDAGSKVYHGLTGTPNADEKRNQQYAVNDQIAAYKKASEVSEQAINEAKNQQDVVKRQINEKQIRSLRNNYRPAGGLLNNSGITPVANATLNNKLGT
jgi:hypothetical protein